MKKLFEIERESRIDVSHLDLRYQNSKQKIMQLNFHHIDGMYSLCTDDNGDIIHLRAWTEVKVIEK
jgi:hypothetical protein